MVGNRPQAQNGDFGSPHYKRAQYLTETMMSEIWVAQHTNGQTVIAKFAIVDEEKLAAKQCLSSRQKNDLQSIERFRQEQRETVRRFLENNRESIRKRTEANQKAIQNEAEQWRLLQTPGYPAIIRLYPVAGNEQAPNAQYYGISTLPGRPAYLIAEYLPGDSLLTLIAQQRGLPVEQALVVLRAVAGSLNYIHTKGYAHLDIKPQNVVFRRKPVPKQPLESAEPTLIDFGIAGKAGHAGGESRSDYWAEKSRSQPQYNRGGITIQCGMDIYSLGLVLRYMLSGEYPPSVSENKSITQAYLPLPADKLKFETKVTADVRTQTAKHLNMLIQRCLMDTASQRPTAAYVLQQAEQLQTLFQPTSKRPLHPRPIWTGVWLTALLALIAAFLIGWWQLNGSGSTAASQPTAVVSGTAVSQAPPSTATLAAAVTLLATQPTLVQSPTPRPTVAPTQQPTAPPTATVPPTAAVPTIPTATPQSLPTSTLVPTATSMPTPEPSSTATEAPTPTATARPPVVNLRAARITAIQKGDGPICGSTWQGKITVRWTVDPAFQLPEGYGYEIVAWAASKNEDLLKVPGMGAVTTNYATINAEIALQQGRNPDLMYNLGVILVRSPHDPKRYQRVKFMGPEGCLFRFAQ